MTGSETFEVEMKFHMPADRSRVLQRLAEFGAVPADDVAQADRYFNHPARDFAQTDEALRIRSIGDSNVVTYKGPKIGTTTKTRLEIEPALGDGPHNAEQFAEVLVALGFRPVATVNKRRQSYDLQRNGRAFEVCIDRVDRVGDFIEIETSAERSGLPEAQQAVRSLADEFQLQDEVRRSYLSMLLATGS